MVSEESLTWGAFTSTRHAKGRSLHETITSKRFFNLLKLSSRSTEISEKAIP